MPAQPSGKRRRVAATALGPLSNVFEKDPAKLAAAYKSAKPYPHAVVAPLCALGDEEKDGKAANHPWCPCPALETVRDEVVTHLTSTFKETDLFKLYQTIDLANLDETQPLFHKVSEQLSLVTLHGHISRARARGQVIPKSGAALRSNPHDVRAGAMHKNAMQGWCGSHDRSLLTCSLLIKSDVCGRKPHSKRPALEVWSTLLQSHSMRAGMITLALVLSLDELVSTSLYAALTLPTFPGHHICTSISTAPCDFNFFHHCSHVRTAALATVAMPSSNTNLLTCFTCSCHSALFVLSGRDMHCQTTQLTTVTPQSCALARGYNATRTVCTHRDPLPSTPRSFSFNFLNADAGDNLLNCLMCSCSYGTACLTFKTEGISTARQLSSRP